MSKAKTAAGSENCETKPPGLCFQREHERGCSRQIACAAPLKGEADISAQPPVCRPRFETNRSLSHRSDGSNGRLSSPALATGPRLVEHQVY